MKNYLINISTLIKRDILRIFPKPALYVIAFVVACTLIGCTTPKHVTQLVRDVQIDTVYISNVKHDSVYINHERLIDRSKDTVYIKDVSVEYKYRLLRDTLRIIQHDSIPFEVKVIETKELTRPLTWFDHLCRTCFYLLSGALLFWIYTKAKKHLR